METSNNTPVKENLKRPWQGTLLGVLNAIGTFLLGLVVLFFVLVLLGGSTMLSTIVEDPSIPLGGLAGLMGFVFLIPAILFLVLFVFITLGIFKGQKWSIIVSIIFTALGLLGTFSGMEILSIIFNGFVLYTEIICIKHPFYNQKSS